MIYPLIILILSILRLGFCEEEEEEEKKELVDLLSLGEPFPIISETRRIFLEEYPTAHNPSIVPFGEGFLLVFRHTPDLYGQPWTSYIGVVLLNRQLEQISEPQLLNTRSRLSKTPSQAEDARLFFYRERLFIIYNDNIDVCFPKWYDRRDMFMAELLLRDGNFTLSTPLKLIHHEKYNSSYWQKNWVPFEWHRQLLLAYTMNPHEILFPDLLRGDCYPCYETAVPIEWDLGILRLSAPPILVDGEYLSFFHSGTVLATEVSWEYELWHYFMGAYTFSAEPPFKITRYTRKPIIEEKFYTKSHYIKRVVFPGGLAVLDDQIYLSYGKDDSEMWIAIIDKEALNQALVPISE